MAASFLLRSALLLMLGLALSEVVGAAPSPRMEAGRGRGVLQLDLILGRGARGSRNKREEGRGKTSVGPFDEGKSCEYGEEPISETGWKEDMDRRKERFKQAKAVLPKEMLAKEESCNVSKNAWKCIKLKGECDGACEKTMSEKAKRYNNHCKKGKCYFNSKRGAFMCSGHDIKPAFGLILVLLAGSLLSYFQ
jgi:hypothetical protein